MRRLGYTITRRNGEVESIRVSIENQDGPGEEADRLDFVFTCEGLIIDAVTGGMVEGTESATFEEIEDRLQ